MIFKPRAHGKVVKLIESTDGGPPIAEVQVRDTPDLRFSQPAFYVRAVKLGLGDELVLTVNRRRWEKAGGGDGSFRQDHWKKQEYKTVHGS